MATVRRTLRDFSPEIDDDDPIEESPDGAPAPAWFAVARGAALFLGCMLLLDLVGDMRFPQAGLSVFSAIDLPIPKPATRGFFGLTGVLMVAFSCFPRMNTGTRRLAALCTLGLFGTALWTTYRFYVQFRTGHAQTGVPAPFALHLAAVAAVILPGLLLATPDRFNLAKDVLFGWSAVAICVVGFPIGQFFCVGKMDERRAADAAMVVTDAGPACPSPDVFGERVRGACALYREGQVHKLIFVGRPAEASADAQKSLRQVVLQQGVTEADLLNDCTANTSEGALSQAVGTLQQQKLNRVLIYAPFFQIPRLKLSCRRAGLEAYCVPAPEERRPRDLQAALVREATAWWLSYLQPILM